MREFFILFRFCSPSLIFSSFFLRLRRWCYFFFVQRFGSFGAANISLSFFIVFSSLPCGCARFFTDTHTKWQKTIRKKQIEKEGNLQRGKNLYLRYTHIQTSSKSTFFFVLLRRPALTLLLLLMAILHNHKTTSVFTNSLCIYRGIQF